MSALWWMLTLSVPAAASEPWPAAERDAVGLIDRCRLDPGACREDTTALARAFLIRATAASLLRGELDPVATVDARLLDAALTDAWAAMLPDASGVQPDPWVVALAAAAWASPPTPALDGPRVYGALGTFTGVIPFDPHSHARQASIGLEARLRLVHDVAVHVGAEFGTSQVGLAANYGDSERSSAPDLEGELVGGVGRWWSFREGGTGMLSADLTLGAEGLSKAGQRWLYERGVVSEAPALGVGVRADQSARLSATGRAPLYVTLDSHLGYQHRVALPWSDPAYATAPTGVWLRSTSPRVEIGATLGFEGVVRDHLRVGGAVVAELLAFPPHVPQVEFHVGPVLRLGWISAPRGSASLASVEVADAPPRISGR